MKTRLLQLSIFLAAFLGSAQIASAQYCTPSYTTSCQQYYMTVRSFSTSGGSVNITNNNQSGAGCGNGAGYSYYSSMGHTSSPGSEVNFSVTTGPNYPVRVYLWVDYNQDGDFYDAGEQVAYNNYVANNGTWTGSFTIPATAASGATRMRIRTLYYGSSGMNPCNNLPYGESEDYNFSIQGMNLTSATKTGACPGQDSVTVAYSTSVSYLNSGNSMTAQMSDTSGSFASATTLGSWSTTASADSAQFAIPNILAHPGYQIRLISSNPADTSSNLGLGYLSTLPESPSWIFATDTVLCEADSVSFIDTVSLSLDSFVISLGNSELNGTSSCGGQEYSCGSIAMTWTDTANLTPVEVRYKIYSTLNCNGTAVVNFSLNGGAAEVETLNYNWCSCSTPTSGQMFSVTFDPNDYNVGGSNTVTMTTSTNSCLGFKPSSALGGDIGQVYIVTGGAGVEYSLSSSFNSILSQNDTFTSYVSSTVDYYYRSQNNFGCYSDTFETQTIQVSSLDISASLANNVSCYQGNNGAITATSTGGLGTVEYSVDGTNWQTSVSLTGLEAGSYVVYARDDESCMDSTTAIVVDEPALLVASTVVDDSVSCFNGNDGSATGSATGGTTSYSYSWSNSSSSATATTLTAGTYTVTVTDANSCTDVESVTISEPTELVAQIDSSGSASCVDNADAFANASASGGVGSYSYLWSNAATTALNENLAVNEYIVVVTDGNDCEASDTIDIIFEDSIAPMVMIQNITAYLDTTGSVTINATQIDNGSSDSCGISQMIISDSVFTCDDTLNEVVFTVVDVNGNFASDTAIVMITDTIAPSIICADSIEICESVLSLVDATTTDNCESSVSQISGPIDGDTLMTGSYTSEFLAIDIFGNESTCSVGITVNPLPVIELGNDSIFCDSIEFTVDAGNAGSSFDWSTGESSQTILVTDSGNYTVTVTDANGCESSSSIHVGLKVCVGIDEVGNPIYMTVYPNPTTNMVNVQIDGFANEVRYDILDINGKLVQSSNRNGVSSSSVEVIDISAFSSGIYILSVKVNDKTYVQRISKM